MTLMSRREMLDEARKRYWRAGKKEKTRILNEFVLYTKYHRKYALALLNDHRARHKATSRRRKRTYTQEVINALVLIWKICDRIASRRLHPFLPEMVRILENQGTLQLTPATRTLLLQVSRPTIDRLLRPARRAFVPHGRTTTKPATLLKKSIPIRTWADWDDAKPGYLEIDLAAHCGESTEGEYLATLDCVDVCTGWCECRVPLNRGDQAVWAALTEIRQRLPIPLLGIDSDNGPEFINDSLKRYCDTEHLVFTRSRPYKKNDQAHVEGKNWTVVRRHVGYDRYSGYAARGDLNDLYRDLRLYVNFFQPVLKLIDKQRVDGKVKKVYDIAQTPYQRILASPDVRQEDKDKLTALYQTLDPVLLHETIQTKLVHIWQTHANPAITK
jgi:hypothetical protein